MNFESRGYNNNTMIFNNKNNNSKMAGFVTRNTLGFNGCIHIFCIALNFDAQYFGFFYGFRIVAFW